MFVPMVTFRFVIGIAVGAFAVWVAITRFPQLKGVKQGWIFRYCVAMVIIQSIGYILFDMLNLFPLPD